MNDQLRHRELIVYLQQMFEFILIFHPKPCFQGKTDIDPTIYFFQELFQGIRFCQKTCTPVFCHHRPGRAAQIQIHFLISELFQLLHCLQKHFCIIRHNLWNQIDSFIMFRCNVLILLRTDTPVLVRCQKRRKIFICFFKIICLCISVNISADPLQRCKI